jgi:hypothetical protein
VPNGVTFIILASCAHKSTEDETLSDALHIFLVLRMPIGKKQNVRTPIGKKMERVSGFFADLQFIFRTLRPHFGTSSSRASIRTIKPFDDDRKVFYLERRRFRNKFAPTTQFATVKTGRSLIGHN